MNLDVNEFATHYSAALQAYLSGTVEGALEEAYEISRQAVQSGLGVLDVAAIHQNSLIDLLVKSSGPQADSLVKLASDFFLESLSQFEMTHRSYREANQTLLQLNNDLRVVNEELEFERQQAESLLLNILPKPIADRIKQGDHHVVDYFASVSVLFADIVNFTALSRQVSAEDLVRWLDDVFSAFDEIVGRYGLERMKTIGDGYMVAIGVPEPREDNETIAADVALDILHESGKLKTPLGNNLQLRMGLSSGPVIAGVIGAKKFAYDTWGDTVNLASRMESYGLPGHIQVSEDVYRRLGNRYEFERRGKLTVRGVGIVTTYFLRGRRGYASGSGAA